VLREAQEGYDFRIATTKSPNAVRMSYIAGGEQPKSKELPFVIGVIAELAGMPESPPLLVQERPFLAFDLSNFDHVMQEIGPRLALKVPIRWPTMTPSWE
jgi:type VI secretion system protein ImpB